MAKHWPGIRAWSLAAAVLAMGGACSTDTSGGRAGGGEVVDENGNIGETVSDSGDTGQVADTAADTLSDGGGGKCPASAPIGTSATCEAGTTCNYGQECCCGKCSPAVVCSCQGGKFGCLNTDACLAPPDACAGDAVADAGGDTSKPDADGGSADASDAAADGGVPWSQVGDPCNEVMSSIMPCAKGLYCEREVGACTGMGKCAAKPQACDLMYNPVCGCDGKTHGNACGAASAGVNVASKGECGASGNLQWFLTCGDPVCSSWKAKPDIPVCQGDQKEALSCAKADDQCDPKNDCNSVLRCTDKDPKQQVGGCPISRAAFKTGIEFVDAAGRAALAERLLATRLATYRYKAQGPQGRRHLGFLIDDDPQSPAVDASRDMVDLYGYLSMAVATLQTQQQTIEALQAESAALRRETAALRAALAAPKAHQGRRAVRPSGAVGPQ